jgi:hypothetical protein
MSQSWINLAQRFIMYDFIGDIHGHAVQLRKLLTKLGYRKTGGVFQHPSRKAFFVGDLLDGGPHIKDVLNIVLPMLERKSALMVMGNHELNFIGLHTYDPVTKEAYRSRSESHLKSARHTLEQLSSSEIEKLVKDLMVIPLWHQEDAFQAVHACWDQRSIDTIGERYLTNPKLKEMFQKGTRLFDATEIALKGMEQTLPEGLSFKDNYGNIRNKGRVCWWDKKQSFVLPQVNHVAKEILEHETPTLDVDRPTFFGHYWLQGNPRMIHPQAFCLDYSVARDGYLCAYRFDGEKQLNGENIEFV